MRAFGSQLRMRQACGRLKGLEHDEDSTCLKVIYLQATRHP